MPIYHYSSLGRSAPGLSMKECYDLPSVTDAFVRAGHSLQTYMGGEVIDVAPESSAYSYWIKVHSPNLATVIHEPRSLWVKIGKQAVTESLYSTEFRIGTGAATAHIIGWPDEATGLTLANEVIFFDPRSLTCEAFEHTGTIG